jgi:MinD-like ATPase involved in chromosome partitioning or flagellar assembly
VLVPSDVAIPRALTHGRPIVLAEPRSGAARAFAALADRYIAARVPTAATSVVPVIATDSAGKSGKRSFLRKAG